MASKRHQRIKAQRKSCEGKRQYADINQARFGAIQAQNRTNQKMVPYHCKFCGKAHIGHPPKVIQRMLGWAA